MGILDFIKTQMDSNQFLQGGLILSLLGSVLYMLKSAPGRLWGLLKSRILFTAWFDSRDPLFGMFHNWVNRQPFVKGKRDVRIITNHRKDPPEVIMTFGYGTYLVCHEGTWLVIKQSKDEKKEVDEGSSRMMLETYSVTCMFWRRSIVMDLLHRVVDSFSIQETGEIPVYQWRYSCSWCSDATQPKRSLGKLALRKGLAESITADVDKFLSSGDWYESMQIPYQRGYLLTGPAGTGKTTLAACLASEYNLRLCILDLTDILDDGELRRAFTSTPGRSIILIEDFDSFFEGRKNKRVSSKITFSGLLNAINGIVNSQGRIMIISTNQEEDIDPALARMGRIDRRFQLDYADADQAQRLFSLYHPECNGEAIEFGKRIDGKDISPADIAGHFQRCRQSDASLLDVDALLEERDVKRELGKKIAKEAEDELASKKEATPDAPSSNTPTPG